MLSLGSYVLLNLFFSIFELILIYKNIKRGGENIYPRELEEFLHHHPKIGIYIFIVDRKIFLVF
jgi:acyl-CoA synthetase (AMP-forming)/AMP-acid ligase II